MSTSALPDPSFITPGASTSSSSAQKSFKYDVFLSFRGEDTRNNFVGHLYEALKAKSIKTYKDDERIDKGERINDQLLKSIQDSRFYIIVFSKNYASSSWCLDELVKIMECKEMAEHTAYPVFFDVEPTEVRKQSGAVEKAFAENKNKEAAGKWRVAMKEASNLAGWHLKDTANGDESKLIQMIVHEIFNKKFSTLTNADGKLVGMETRISDVLSSLEIGTEDVRMIGIKGMGGGGKTTLARAIYDQISNHFGGKSFVENVREVSQPTLSGLKKLQKRILKDVLKKQDIIVSSVHDGINTLKAAMCCRKILVVLDDVDCIEQLEALVGEHDWFKSGSRIIITTRDEQVLKAHGVKFIHDVNLLSHEEAICLFNMRAFPKELPVEVYKKLSEEVVRYASGLPLTITVLGSLLRGANEREWENTIQRLKKIPLEKTMRILELSFDGLEKEYQEIFLDVACILKGWYKKEAIRVLESRGFCAENGLRVLEQRSLITYNEYEELGMHDHLEEMGRHIVRRLYPDEPNKHSRLWIDEEIEDIMTNDLGTQETKCLRSSFIAAISMKGLANMKDLKVIDISISAESDDDKRDDNRIKWKFDKVSQYLPNSLQFVKWRGFPFSSLPNTFQGKHLVGLDMYYSKIVQLWEDKVLPKLRFVTFKCSKLQTFDLRLAPNLERLTIYGCFNFKELHMPAHHLKLKYLNLDSSELTSLYLGNTPNLEKLKLRHSKLKTIHLGSTPNLEELILNRCEDLVELEMPSEFLKLEELNLSYSKLKTIHLMSTPNLVKLILTGCKDLVELEMPAECLNLALLDISHSKLKTIHLESFLNLEKLILKGCNDLVELKFPYEYRKLKYLDVSHSKLTNLHHGNTLYLETLCLSHSKLTKLHLENNMYLEVLKMEVCYDLVKLEMPAESLKLKSLHLSHSKLKTIHLGSTPNLEELILRWCKDLVELDMPAKSLKLALLDLSHSKLKTIHLGRFPNLEKLILEGCNDLVELKFPSEYRKLKYLNVSHSKLTNLHLGNTLYLETLCLSHSKLTKLHLENNLYLEDLAMEGCNDLVELQMPTESLNLHYLNLSQVQLRTLDLGLTPNLRRLNLKDCYNLVEINAPIGCLKNLYDLDLSGYRSFKSFTFTKWNPWSRPAAGGSFCELHLIAEPTTDVCLLHPNNGFPKFRVECHYKEDPNSSFENLERLMLMGLCACANIEKFSRSICSLRGLRKLTLEGSIPEVPQDLDDLECLEELIFSSTGTRNLPDSVCNLKHLKFLELKSCWLLEKLPDDLGRIESLETLILKNCDRLRDLPSNMSTPNLVNLILTHCKDLVELEMPAECLNLALLDLSHSKLKTIHLESFPNLEKLILEGCNELVELKFPSEYRKLKYLNVSHSKLTNLHLGNTLYLETLCLSHSKLTKLHLENNLYLEVLAMEGCNDLVELQMPTESLNLRYLNLGRSKLRTLHLGLSPVLRRLCLVDCCDLVEINAPIGWLKKLDELNLNGCGRFKSFEFTKWDPRCQPAEAGSFCELHLIAEPTTDVCLLHPDNSFPKFRVECHYEEDPNSSFENLERLILMGMCACTNLENFSRSICSLRSLRKLALEGSIPEVPRDLDKLECLEELIFSSTEIRNLPDSVCRLKHLKSLELKTCWLLEKLPDDLGRIESLEMLILTNCNRLRDLPKNMGKIKCVISPWVNRSAGANTSTKRKHSSL